MDTMTKEDSSRRVRSFPFVARPDALVLILGSMPGVASLEAGEYYAHPRNAFWPIMERLFGIPVSHPYDERLRGLTERRIALWDVLGSCVRPGSLDSAIDGDTVVPNDFPAFFRAHRSIEAVFFNGTMAERSWRRYVAPGLPSSMRTVRLPSTSPAHAGRSLEEKTDLWAVLREALERPNPR